MSIQDFEIICKVGDGSYSTVYKVKRVVDGCVYALKKVRLEHLSTKQVENSVNEVRFLASVRHPNIIAYKEAFYDASSRSLCIVMELAEGGDLLQRIFDYKRNGNQFKEEYIWDIFIQVLKGLNALHELKITHRDIKSANVFLTKGGIAKLGDFNVSTVLRKGMMCETQTGTPYYASPQIWKDQPYDAKSDLWSLGCVLYEFVNLKPPFRARDMDGLFQKVNRGYFGKINRNYSDDFKEILDLLLCPDPFQRMACKDLLAHPIIRARMKKGKEIESAESYSLIRTIKLGKNMNYLTEKLPKPNYLPVRYKSLKDTSRNSEEMPKYLHGSLRDLPKLDRSLKNSSSVRSEQGSLSKSRKKIRYSNIDPQMLPKIVDKRSRRHN